MTPSATCVTRPTSGPRRAVALAAALTLATSLTGCGLLNSDEPTDSRPVAHTGPITIGFSPMNLTSPLLRDLGTGMQGYAKTKGAEVLLADARNDALTQVRQIEAWVESGRVQAIWAIAVDPAALRTVFDQAHAKGIAVLATGTPQDYGQSTLTPGRSYSYIDYRAYGNEVGMALGECAKERLDGKARVLHLQNQEGQVGTADFAAGLRAGLAVSAPTSKVVSAREGNTDIVASAELTSSALRADSAINAVAAANDDALAGALEGYTKSGRSPAKACLVGTGGGTDTLAALRNGSVYAIVSLKYKEDAQQNVDQMMQMVADPQGVGLQLLTPIETITR